MGNEDPQAGNSQTSQQPDANQGAAPTNDNQQGQDNKPTPDTQPKETDAKELEDAILPDEDEGKDGKPAEGEKKSEDQEPDKPTEADSPEEVARKLEARENYWKRQAEKKDEVIDTLTESLQNNYIDQGEDDNDKRLRSLEAREYVAQIRDSRRTLIADNQRVQSEIDLFNPKSQEYVGDKVFEGIMTRYARDNVILKPIQMADGSIRNEVVGYRQPMFEYFAEEADLLSGVKAPAKREKEQASMEANAETPGGGPSPSSRQKTGEDDDFMKGFNSVK